MMSEGRSDELLGLVMERFHESAGDAEFMVVEGLVPTPDVPCLGPLSTELMRTLGAEVKTLDLWEDAGKLFEDKNAKARAVVIDAGERPDLAASALRSVRKTDPLAETPAIVARTPEVKKAVFMSKPATIPFATSGPRM